MPNRATGRGVVNFVAAPSKREQTGRSGGSMLPVGSAGVSEAGVGASASFRGRLKSPPMDATPRTISGVTRDNTGTPLGNCTVWLFDTRTKAFLAEVLSDGGGAFAFGFSGPCFAVAYSSSGAVAGVTLNTLSEV